MIAPEETYMTSTQAVSAETQKTLQSEQLACAEGYLKSSQASFLMVAGHYPLFSTGMIFTLFTFPPIID